MTLIRRPVPDIADQYANNRGNTKLQRANGQQLPHINILLSLDNNTEINIKQITLTTVKHIPIAKPINAFPINNTIYNFKILLASLLHKTQHILFSL